MNKNRYCAFFRVDVNNEIGSGHFVRCRLLAEKLNATKIKTFFIYKELPGSYNKQLSELGFETYQIQNGEETDEIISFVNNCGCGKSILITDSDKDLFYSKEFQLKIKESGIKLMTITFYDKTHFYSDIILNQNIMAPGLKYSTEEYTIKLLGTQYVILDPRFEEIRKNKKPVWNEKNNVVLISFGGVDKPDRTSFVYEILKEFEQQIEKIIIVLGALYGNKNKIEKLIENSKVETELYQNTGKMPYLMAESKYAFTSGGLTAWELGVTKTLNIIIAESDREYLSGKYIGENGFGYFLGRMSELSRERLVNSLNSIFGNHDKNIKMVENLSAGIDPAGANKVVENILKVLG